MTFGLVHASYTLPEWQAVKLTFFAPCLVEKHNENLTDKLFFLLTLKLFLSNFTMHYQK